MDAGHHHRRGAHGGTDVVFEQPDHAADNLTEIPWKGGDAHGRRDEVDQAGHEYF